MESYQLNAKLNTFRFNTFRQFSTLYKPMFFFTNRFSPRLSFLSPVIRAIVQVPIFPKNGLKSTVKHVLYLSAIPLDLATEKKMQEWEIGKVFALFMESSIDVTFHLKNAISENRTSIPCRKSGIDRAFLCCLMKKSIVQKYYFILSYPSFAVSQFYLCTLNKQFCTHRIATINLRFGQILHWGVGHWNT